MNANNTSDNRRLSPPAFASASTAAGVGINQPHPPHFLQTQQPSIHATAPVKNPYAAKRSTVKPTQSVDRRKHVAEHRQCVDQRALNLYDEVFDEDGD